MSTTNIMKKFGRGFVLDFTALMNEVRSPSQTSPDDITSSTSTTGTPTSPITSFDACKSTGQSSTNNLDHDSGFSAGENQNGSGADTTPSPTDDSPSDASHGMKRKPTRMSVSRTGRLKNRDRQRTSVLETSDFYRVKPNAPLPPSVPGTNDGRPTDRDASGRKATESAASSHSETLADFDGTIAALDGSTPTPSLVTDCYSF